MSRDGGVSRGGRRSCPGPVRAGRTHRTAAWDRLAASSARFRRFEALFSLIWGLALLADCAARLIGACTLPVSTMVWLGTVLILGTIVLASLVSGWPRRRWTR
jgi:hypothetical protein